MSKRVVIFEADDGAREGLKAALVAYRLADVCDVTAVVDAAVIWCGDKGEKLPAKLGIRKNDCFTKPVRVGAVFDRVRWHVQGGAKIQERQTIDTGAFSLDVAAGELTLRDMGAKIRLTDKEKQILVLLSEAGGQVIGRQALLERVWGYTEVLETHTLETHIYRLRQKIERDPVNPEILITDGAGYRIKI